MRDSMHLAYGAMNLLGWRVLRGMLVMVLFMLVGLVVLGLGLVRPGGGVIARVCDPTLPGGWEKLQDWDYL